FKAGDYDAARELFQKAWARYDREPLIALALAKAYDRAGLLEKAQIYYEHFLRLAPPTKEYLNDREQAVQRLAIIKDQLKSRPGILKFKGLPTGARLEVDGKPADVDAAGELKVTAGSHSVRVTMEKRLPFDRPVVAVGPGEVKDIEVVLVAPVDPSTLPRDHKWTWVAGGTAAAGLIATGVFGFLYWQEYDAWSARFDANGRPNSTTRAEYSNAQGKCEIGNPYADTALDPCKGATDEGNRRKATTQKYQIGTAVAGGVTALAAIGTVVAFYSAPTLDPSASKPATSLLLLPRIGPDGAGLQLALRF
ncbi:MAG: tetratricopeptide repeat protein, partial [Deltaproteobacteria bacterium]|nr:tetratricopeptide repeat protein [Deltaproteobacteria bacterium]